MSSKTIEVSTLGRPMFPGMLYDCRADAFISGVTLWDKKSLSEGLDTHSKPQTDLKFSNSDFFSDKSNLMDISASLKASFMGGLVDVGGSAKYLRDTKSSNQQSRVTMFYSETTRFEQLTMNQLGDITYPQVFDQKTATHVVTAALYGAQAFMVFDWIFPQDEDKQVIERKLSIMVKKIPGFSIEGKGAVEMTDGEKKTAENISCTFHGDFHLEQNPTTYMEALQVYKQLPKLLKDNPQNVVPVKVWLYPLHLLDTKAARLMREISTHLVSYTEVVMEELEEAERRCNDLLGMKHVDLISDIKERLSSFQSSFSTYRTVFQKALGRVLPCIRAGEMEEHTLENVMMIHKTSPFDASMQWLDDTKAEFDLLSFYINSLKGVRTEDTKGLKTILLNPDIEVVVCLALTSLTCQDQYLSTLNEFLQSDEFKELDGMIQLHSVTSDQKWFNDPDVITKMRETLSHFKSFAEANKDDEKMCFIISAISDSSSPGSSIYLYEQGKLTDKHFQPLSKPPAPIVKSVQQNAVSLKLQKSPAQETVKYKVEYRPEDKEEWLFTNTADSAEEFTLTGLESDTQYLIRYRTVGKVGVSEASDTVFAQPPSTPPVTVGGSGGVAFSFIFDSTIQMISITYDRFERLHSIQVTLDDGRVFERGTVKGQRRAEFVFDKDDKIIAATLWPNMEYDRAGGVEFEVEKSNGKRRKFSVLCKLVGQPVRLDVKSGRCNGIIGRSGWHLDALGFCFI